MFGGRREIDELKRKLAEERRKREELERSITATPRTAAELPGSIAVVGSYGGPCPYCHEVYNGELYEQSVSLGDRYVKSRFAQCPKCGQRWPA